MLAMQRRMLCAQPVEQTGGVVGDDRVDLGVCELLPACGVIRRVGHKLVAGSVRRSDGFGRHKALDLIGDLALVGRPLKARIVAHKAGHALHTQLVTRLLADRSLWTETTEKQDAALQQPLAMESAPVRT